MRGVGELGGCDDRDPDSMAPCVTAMHKGKCIPYGCDSATTFQIPNKAKAREIGTNMVGSQHFPDHLANGNSDSRPITLGTFQLVRDSQIQAGNWMLSQPQETQEASRNVQPRLVPQGTDNDRCRQSLIPAQWLLR